MSSLTTSRLTAFLLAAALVPPTPSIAQERGETVWIPMEDKGLLGVRQIKLEASLYKPQREGRFPVVIFNHGSTGMGAFPATRTENPAGFGRNLIAKGIALLVPMRRGRGQSEGTYQEPYDCSLSQVRLGIRYAMDSLDAVYAYLKQQPWADSNRIILSGSSRGALLSVLYAAEREGSAIGVLNFVGGWVNDRCSQLHGGTDVNALLFKEAGAKSRVPHLFLYAANDSFYSVTSIEKFPRAFKEGGGAVSFKLYNLPSNVDGHTLFHRHWTYWGQDVDAFLTSLGVWRP